MNGVQEAIPYEEVSAHQANSGVETYALPSGGIATGGFVVLWDLEDGFSHAGWDFYNEASPAYEWSEEQIKKDAADGNLNDMFKAWADRLRGNEGFSKRMNWVVSWMDTHIGCVIESNV